MPDLQMGAIERRFADIIWEHAPVTTLELVAFAKDALEWKRTTTYTVLRRLCEKGLFQNSKGVVTPLMTRQDYEALQSTQFVSNTFSGSLPAFIAAFTKHQKLTEQEVEEIRRIIDQIGED